MRVSDCSLLNCISFEKATLITQRFPGSILARGRLDCEWTPGGRSNGGVMVMLWCHHPRDPSSLPLRETHSQRCFPIVQRQQVNTARVGDISLLLDSSLWAQIWDPQPSHSPSSLPHGPNWNLCRRSCKHLTVCVKPQHQVKCFICFLKSQPYYFTLL